MHEYLEKHSLLSWLDAEEKQSFHFIIDLRYIFSVLEQEEISWRPICNLYALQMI